MPQLTGPRRRYLLFSVDTEPDDPEWRGLLRGGWTHENLRGLGRLADACRGLGVKPTFFLSHSVAVHVEAAGALFPLLREGRCEVGVHLHPGDTPPLGDWDRVHGDNVIRLPDALLEAKFGALHWEVWSRFGRPTSYRSAAWALDARVVGLLERHGYLADSSVTPGISWRLNGRPDYLAAPRGAYRLGKADLCAPGEGPLVEVPVSIWSPHPFPPGSPRGRYLGDLLTMPLAGRRGPAARALKAMRPQPPVWLRPAFKGQPDLEEVARRLEGEEYLHVMCHSNELWPGASPYVADAAGLEEYYARLIGLFRYALAQGYIPVTVSEYAGLFADGAAGAAGQVYADREGAGPGYPVALDPIPRAAPERPAGLPEEEPRPSPRARRGALIAAKATVSALALAFAVGQVDWGEMGRILSRVDPALALACLGARLGEMGINAWKLAFLLRPAEVAPGLVFRCNLIKVLFNSVLPGGAGGEGVRMLLLGRETGSLGRASGAVVADRLTGLWAQVVFTAASAPFLAALVDGRTRFLSAAAAGALGLGMAVLVLGPGPRLFASLLRRSGGARAARLAGSAEEFRGYFRDFASGPRRVAGLLGYCLASQLALLLILDLAVRALGGSLAFAQLSPIILACALSALIPLTLGGLGVAEGAFALAFSLAGSQAELGLLTSLLLRGIGVAPALAGGALFLRTPQAEEWSPWRKPRAAAAAPIPGT